MASADAHMEAVPMPGVSQEARNAQVRAVLQGLAALRAVVFFEKPLTSSDTAGSGRVIIPKAVAEQYFPRLEHQSGVTVSAVDTRGRQYTFKYRFWVNNHVSRMYVMEGASELHRAYDMSVGDVMVFAQRPDGALVVAGRPATMADQVKKPSAKRQGRAEAGAGTTGRRDARQRQQQQQQQLQQQQQQHQQQPGLPPQQPQQTGRKSKSAVTEQGVPIDGVFRALGHGAGRQQRRVYLTPYVHTRLVHAAVTEQGIPIDGVFRALGHGAGRQQGGVQCSRQGRWSVVLSLLGELYQAYFDSEEDAHEAFNAAGASATLPAGA